ncbi:Cytosine deaminase [Lachnellula cervina]|uniref:Cytosine deaminase n=1 Tax=Lachnellula cervina TaxID=1316786 RepID=A0A7D8USM4_9HELO|nr:Cytosine deaminase [Lachnellula cervina]
MSASDAGFLAAIQEAKAGAEEGGMPIGGAIVSSSGELLGTGRNRFVQDGSLLHADVNIGVQGGTSAFENAKHHPLAAFKNGTLYTTLSPCPMCAGAAIFFQVKRIVIGENKNMSGREEYLRQHGIEVIVLNDQVSTKLMTDFITNQPQIW